MVGIDTTLGALFESQQTIRQREMLGGGVEPRSRLSHGATPVAALVPIRVTEGAPAALERVTGSVAALLPIRVTEGAPAALERVTGIEPA
ncbi:MAG: hypothetical protein RIS41_139 [Actinomycetota bacterium]